MNNAKAAVRFVQELPLKTEQGKIRRQQAAVDEMYVAAVGGKFGLAISDKGNFPVRPMVPIRGCVLKVDDGKGELIWIEPEELGELDNKLRELYDAVRKQAALKALQSE
jgi:hypothetical protein